MANLLKELLEISNRIARGEIPVFEHNELYTAGGYDLLIIHAHDAEAFSLLTEACGRYREMLATGADLKGYFVLLSSLAINSRTTQLPMGMKEIIAEHPQLSCDLQDWYRVIP